MKLRPSKIYKRGPLIISGCVVCVFLLGILSELFAGPPMLQRGPQGMRHHLHHGQGHIGSGVCPQLRVTAQAPDGIYNLKNPLPSTMKHVFKGEAYFQTDAHPTACKVCHGAVGNGLGMMAQGLKPPPRNFTCKETMQEIPDGQLFWVIKNGAPGTGMPAYKDLQDEAVWQIVHYIRWLSK